MRLLKRIGVVIVVVVCAIAPTTLNAQAVIGLDRGPEAPHLLKDEPVDDFRLELIDLAWQAATSYPLNPHIKNRAKAEEQVVNGALGIKQSHLAWGYAKKVVNWRRGACYAEIAHYLIEQGDSEHVEYFLRQAILHSKDPQQGWRQARVKARVAAARVLMGNAEGAEGLIDDEDYAGQGESIGAQAALASVEAFDQLVAALDDMVATQGYNETLAAMFGYADMYRHYYENEDRRKLLLDRTKTAWKDMPGIRRFEVMLKFIDAAIANDDLKTALVLIDETDTIRQSFSWPVDYDLKFRSDIARYRVAIGQDKAARFLLNESIEVLEQKLESLENFYRAGALRPIAEGFAVLGDKERAREIYARVVELGAVNPNIRPRVSDITATCVSMALHNIEPDAELLSKIQQIVEGIKK